ncbi:putative pyrazinamidase nicotinamidase protein [Lasiodiplodia theobromae]|uniref:nicotinamidase n=1 Tax=Lasiodiplodia theobromae TaxID=45133 RepID=A0A5N5DNN7_9PEZI|nr:Pyrazinamidase nicotinamidase [Lasiodiplodia theobromae]KAB2579357.1 Nicotinamidase [Lasiodiplodia theobromae]KAF4542109.1 Pyrazinamidase nicotinamidase [Lasiodiplodia theobromae]KAF9635457.1 putative pyrazinamidase nicotinamidase protein [Lasiodiplodia theobromae]
MASAPSNADFKPALVIVDVQEDFCPPNGALAVQDGRTIAPTINRLLRLPFAARVATKDWHPRDHVSFASNHAAPDNVPFVTTVTIANPLNASETQTTRLWPDHCIQGTPGAELIPELDQSRVTHVLEKGQDRRVEMYSAFADPFRSPTVARSGLADLLRAADVSDVFVVGLAMDYCVKFTALDAVREGFRTVVVTEGTKPVDPSKWAEVQQEMEAAGVGFVSVDGDEIKRVEQL